MPEEASSTKVLTDAEQAAAKEAAKKKKGSQRLTCYAYADPTSIFVFSLGEKVVTYFQIDLTAPAAGEAKVYKSKTRTVSSTSKRKIFGGTLRKKGRKIMKYITLPASAPDKPIPSAKENGKARKQVRIRIPAAMSINAISVWINGQFKENIPRYYTTQSGTVVEVNKTFKEKSKLNDIGLKG